MWRVFPAFDGETLNATYWVLFSAVFKPLAYLLKGGGVSGSVNFSTSVPLPQNFLWQKVLLAKYSGGCHMGVNGPAN